VIIPFDNRATAQPLIGEGGEGVGIPSDNTATVQPLRPGENLDIVGDRITQREPRRPAFALLQVAEKPRIDRGCNTS
jgi:hypothetical protein